MGGFFVARRSLLASVAGVAAALLPLTTALGRRSDAHKREIHRNRRVVALDPGHGGTDPGAISPHGLHESRIALAIALHLAERLEASGRFRPVLTRRSDVFVPLHDRVARARRSEAELFLSLHADALPDSTLRGLSVYTLSEHASDHQTAALAMRENRDDFVRGLRLSRQSAEIGAVLFDLARRQTSNRSQLLAREIIEELGRVVPLLEKPHRSAAFIVLTAPDIPSGLVELGCLSNPTDEGLLPQPAFQRRLAQALARAIDDYFATPHLM